jgi:hypothetical protein
VTDNDRPDDTYRATIVRAAEILGGPAALSRRLQVPMPEITRWLTGAGRPSIGLFLKVIDVLIEENRTPTERLQVRADRSQAQADRSQAKADRDQAKADRDQIRADREEAKTERDRTGSTQHFGHVQPEGSEPASNDPDQESGKGTG